MSQTFAELGLNPERIAGLEVLGYEKPSRLQREVIPQILAGRDVVVEGAPGSGKTAAFVLPILQTLNPDVVGIQVMVFVPTGGDAARVAAVFQSLNANQNLHIVPVSEDQPIAREAARIDRTAVIIIGTPGRIKAHIERETFGLEQVQVVVIDGADQLLDDDQIETLAAVLDQAPGSRQTSLFATQLDTDLQEFAEQHLFEPVVLKREAGPVAMPLIKHRYQSVNQGDKTTAMLRLLDGENIDRALVFINLRPDAERIAQVLRTAGYHAATLHSRTPAETREGLVRSWRDESLNFLVLTQAAAADLVLEVPYALSFDVPTDAETYANRAKLVVENGSLFTLLAPRERAMLSEIENFLGMRVKAVLPPTRADTVAQRTEAFKQALRDIIGRSNLEIYMMLLNDLAEEGHDWSEIAAAAVSMLQHAQTETIFTKRTDRRPPPAASQPQSTTYSSSPAPQRYREPVREREQERERSRPRDEEREVEAGYIRLIMDAGYDIGVRPKDIVGAIANEANIPGRAVGNIDIRDRFTYVEVQEEFIDRVLNRVPSTRLRGRVVTFRRA